MIKRLSIMLIATGLVFGAIFGFQIFKAKMIAAGDGGIGQSAANGIGHDRANAGMAAADRGCGERASS